MSNYVLDPNTPDAALFAAVLDIPWRQDSYAHGAAAALGLVAMFEAIRKNAPRCCDNCGRGWSRQGVVDVGALAIGDGIGHEFCSAHCYDRFHPHGVDQRKRSTR